MHKHMRQIQSKLNELHHQLAMELWDHTDINQSPGTVKIIFQDLQFNPKDSNNLYGYGYYVECTIDDITTRHVNTRQFEQYYRSYIQYKMQQRTETKQVA